MPHRDSHCRDRTVAESGMACGVGRAARVHCQRPPLGKVVSGLYAGAPAVRLRCGKTGWRRGAWRGRREPLSCPRGTRGVRGGEREIRRARPSCRGRSGTPQGEIRLGGRGPDHRGRKHASGRGGGAGARDVHLEGAFRAPRRVGRPAPSAPAGGCRGGPAPGRARACPVE